MGDVAPLDIEFYKQENRRLWDRCRELQASLLSTDNRTKHKEIIDAIYEEIEKLRGA